MTSLASREMTEQEMINTSTAPQMAHLIQILRQTIRSKDKEIEKWVDIVNQLQRDGELDPPEPEKESPIDPIERPLRSLILRAKEEGKNIRTYYQDMVFTPCNLDGLLADGKFRWWNISNWELTNREQNYYPQISYDEPNPEPAFKVGDWVEVEQRNGGKSWTSQHKVKTIYKDGSGYGINYYGDEQPVGWDGLPVSLHCISFVRVIRKLDPSEVVVRIGCLSGTVAPGCNDTTIMIVPIGYNGIGDVAIIPVAMLDTQTCTLVKNLLKAQEEK